MGGSGCLRVSPAATAIRGAALVVCSVLFLLISTACSKPSPFSRGQRIQMGPYTISVSHAAVSSLDAQAQYLVVHYRCEEIDSKDAARRFALLFMGQMTITDGDGNKYWTLPPTTAGRYRSRKPGPALEARQVPESLSDSEYTPNEWVAVAKVPIESQGFTLLIRNPRPRDGQPSLAAIALGR